MSDENFKKIVDFLLDCPLNVVSQQMDEPDLSENEKRNILQSLMSNNPVNFLTRFGKFLTDDHLNYFLNKYDTSYEINHYVKKFKHLLNDRRKHVQIRNRRFEAMQRMEASGKYFTLSEMEKRDPVLYHQMIGQYLSEEEKQKKLKDNEFVIPTFSNFLLNELEKEEYYEILNQNKDEEEDEEIESEESPPKDINNKTSSELRWGADWEDEKVCSKIDLPKTKCQYKPTPEEKVILSNEFKSLMQHKFLNGEDNDFNYSDVDSNSDYDCLDVTNQDEEEKYFDEENPYCSSECTDTGIEDY